MEFRYGLVHKNRWRLIVWSTEQRHGLECLWSGDDVMSRVTMKAIRTTELDIVKSTGLWYEALYFNYKLHLSGGICQ